MPTERAALRAAWPQFLGNFSSPLLIPIFPGGCAQLRLQGIHSSAPWEKPDFLWRSNPNISLSPWIWLCSLSLFLGVNVVRFLGILPVERRDGSSVLAVPSCARRQQPEDTKSSSEPSLGSQKSLFSYRKCGFSCSPRAHRPQAAPAARRSPGSLSSRVPRARCSFGVNNSWDAFKASSVLPERGPRAIKAWTCCLPTSTVISEP